MEVEEKPKVSHEEKPNAEQGYNLVALSLGPNAASGVSSVQGVEFGATEASPALESCKDTQVVSSCILPGPAPLATIISGGTSLPDVCFASESHSGLPDSLMVAISNPLMVSNRIPGEDGSHMGPPVAISSAAFVPKSTTSVLSENLGAQFSPALIPALTPPLPKATTSAMESGLSLSDHEEKPFIKEETSTAADKCKVRKRPRQLLHDARDRDVNKSSEKHSVIRWKDVWVAQLIHIRGRMHSTFTSPQRQRVDLWQIVKQEMTNSCFGFDKDSEACRKKWIRVYKEYKDDLHLSNDERAQKCRFYDLVDFYMGTRARANGLCNAPIRPDLKPPAKEMAVMSMPNAEDAKANEAGVQADDVNVKANEVDVKANEVQGGIVVPYDNSHNLTPDAIIKKPHGAKRLRIIEKSSPSTLPPHPTLEALFLPLPPKKLPIKASTSSVQTMLSELVSIGKEMLQTTREFEREKLTVLHSIKDTLGKIAKEI